MRNITGYDNKMTIKRLVFECKESKISRCVRSTLISNATENLNLDVTTFVNWL